MVAAEERAQDQNCPTLERRGDQIPNYGLDAEPVPDHGKKSPFLGTA